MNRRKFLLGTAAIAAAANVPLALAKAIPVADWIPLDGRALSRSMYSELFSVIGLSYGGDDKTFNLPNYAAPKMAPLLLDPMRPTYLFEYRIRTSGSELFPCGSVTAFAEKIV